jgi:hypothetical protein
VNKSSDQVVWRWHGSDHTINSCKNQSRRKEMVKCKDCSFFIKVPESADDFAPGKGDCITEVEDEKGKYWLSKPVFETTEACETFKKSF